MRSCLPVALAACWICTSLVTWGRLEAEPSLPELNARVEALEPGAPAFQRTRLRRTLRRVRARALQHEGRGWLSGHEPLPRGQLLDSFALERSRLCRSWRDEARVVQELLAFHEAEGVWPEAVLVPLLEDLARLRMRLGHVGAATLAQERAVEILARTSGARTRVEEGLARVRYADMLLRDGAPEVARRELGTAGLVIPGREGPWFWDEERDEVLAGFLEVRGRIAFARERFGIAAWDLEAAGALRPPPSGEALSPRESGALTGLLALTMEGEGDRAALLLGDWVREEPELLVEYAAHVETFQPGFVRVFRDLAEAALESLAPPGAWSTGTEFVCWNSTLGEPPSPAY